MLFFMFVDIKFCSSIFFTLPKFNFSASHAALTLSAMLKKLNEKGFLQKTFSGKVSRFFRYVSVKRV